MTNDLNQQQIIHGYIPQQPQQQQQQQQQFISYPNYEQSAVQGQTVYAFNNLNDFRIFLGKFLIQFYYIIKSSISTSNDILFYLWA